MKEETIMPSDTLSDFLNWLTEMRELYNACSKEVNDEDKKVQDFLHAIEFAENKSVRNKIATKLANSRKERRKAKDQVLLLKSIIEFLDAKENRECINRMKKLLGVQRKEERYLLSERHYNNKVDDSCTTPVIDPTKFKL